MANVYGSGIVGCTLSGVSAWTSFDGVLHTYWNGGGTDIGRAEWFYRIADGTADDTPTIVCSVTPGTGFSAAITRCNGVNAATPIADFEYAADGTSPITCPSVDAAVNDSLAVVMGATYVSETGTWTFGNSFTARLATTSGRAHFVATKAVNAGAVGTVDVTNTTTLLRFGVVSLVLNPSTGVVINPINGLATDYLNSTIVGR
jgi:hypothetical protein